MENNKKNFDNWQREVLEASGNILLCTGRRVGKTTIFAAKAAERMVAQKNTSIVAVSLTEDQAFLMRVMVEDYLIRNYKAYLKVPKNKKPTKNVITLNNGSTYIVRPVGQTGNALRGFNANVLIVDEASFMPEDMWSAATPTLLTTAGEIWLCSTPNVKAGWFYEQFEACRLGKSKRFKVWHISSEEVVYNRPVSETWTKELRDEVINFLNEEKASKSKLRYGQEYMGLFMEDLMRVFSDDWIKRVCENAPEPTIRGNSYYLGVDIARMGGDETAFEVIHKIDKENYTHVFDEHKSETPTTWTEARILQLDSEFKFEKIYIDAGSGSLGVGVFDHLLQIEEVKRKVEAINNRKIVQGREIRGMSPPKQKLMKEDLYDNLLWLGETGKIKLLDSDAVRASLRSITKEIVITRNGVSRIVINGTYSHIVEGLIRAAWCAKEKDIKIWISSFPI